MLTRAWILAALLVAAGCTCDPAPTIDAGAAAPDDEEEGLPIPTTRTPPLLGSYEGRPPPQPEGAIGMTQRYRFDGQAYEMSGYPSIGERGNYLVATTAEGRTVLRLTSRLGCGPCEAAGPNEPRESVEVEVEIADEGASFTMRGWTFRRVEGAP